MRAAFPVNGEAKPDSVGQTGAATLDFLTFGLGSFFGRGRIALIDGPRGGTASVTARAVESRLTAP